MLARFWKVYQIIADRHNNDFQLPKQAYFYLEMRCCNADLHHKSAQLREIDS
jgi:hypothetical protein